MGSPVTLQVINKDYKLERMKDLERPRPSTEKKEKLTLPERSNIWVRFETFWNEPVREKRLSVLLPEDLQNRSSSLLELEVSDMLQNLVVVAIEPQEGDIDQLRGYREASEVYSLNPGQDAEICKLIDEAGDNGDTLGGVLEVRIEGLPFGLGTHAQWDRKLDGKIAQAVMAVQAIKGVEIGLRFEAARRPGSQVHDPIMYDESKKQTPSLGYERPTNNAGRT